MWEQIRANRTRSIILIVLMAAVLMGIGYAIGIFVASPVTGLIIALLVWLFMTMIAFFQGDNILLGLSHAHKIKPEDHPRLYNVVEEMKIASGLQKMPDVYIIDDPALNAFATGRDPNHAAVAITSGLLERLNRDELQGVIAHEMSHIKNRDVLLMSMAGVMLGTIVILAWYVSRMLFFTGGMGGGRRDSGGGGGGGGQGAAILMIIGLVFIILAPIAAQLLYFAVSRRREYLADASGALFTRYPEGLASALEKIGGSTQPVKNANQATAPMYIANPFRSRKMNAASLTSTHPPIQERIRILRAMGGNVSYAKYEENYEKAHGGGRVMPSSAMGIAPVAAREASGERPLGVTDRLRQRRETSDALDRVHDYRIVTCECGTKWKVPADYQEDHVLCTRCGRTIDLRR